MKKIIEEGILYITEHFIEPILNADISNAVNQSEYHFQRQFKEEMGITPQKYIEWVRIEYAKHLMKIYPGLKKSELAYECGFNSPTSFNRAFKRQTDLSPREYELENLFNTFRQKTSRRGKNQFEISYSNEKFFNTSLLNPLSKNIENEMDALRADGHLNLMGVYIDVPLHTPIEKCRYLLGYEVKETKIHNQILSEGYYANFSFIGSWEQLAQIASAMLEEAEKRKYKIKKLIAFEEIILPLGGELKYEKTERKIIIPLSR